MDGEIISAPFKSCCLCRNSGELFRMNTAYIEDELNYTDACERCQPIIQQHWRDEWDDFYSSRMR